MPAALRSPPALVTRTKATPRPCRRFPRGSALSGEPPRGGQGRGPPAAAQQSHSGLHPSHLHRAPSRQAVAAFETLHYHVLPRWLDHPALHGGSLTAVARETALTAASGRAVRHDAWPRPQGGRKPVQGGFTTAQLPAAPSSFSVPSLSPAMKG